MRIFIVILVFSFISGCLSAQAPVKEETLKDSAAILQDIVSLLDSADESSSYGLISVSIGNRLFSLRNNQLNSRQSSTSTIIYTPSAGYFHKSGLSFSAATYLLNDAVKGFGANQYSITPAFDLQNNTNINFGISFTRYFVKDKFSSYSSPIQNDFYTSFIYSKPWLKPGIALGYSTGEYKQSAVKDTLLNAIHRVIYDTATFKLHSVSVMVSASHQFGWYNIISNNDGFVFTPSLMLNFGSSNTSVSHKTNAPNLLNFLIKKGKIRRELNNSLRAESAGLNIDCNYAAGNFSFNPQLYLDYYLPKTSEKKFTDVFTVTIGYSF